MRRVASAAGLVLAALAAAGTLRADWLLMKDGSRLEIRGGWEVRGQQVVVTLTNGTLAAVRLDKVDLDGSARITAEARAPQAAPTPVTPRRPAVTLTNDDLPPTSRAPLPAAAASPSAPGAVPAAPAPTAITAVDSGSGLEVTTWSQRYEPETERTTLSGTVRNPGDTLAYDAAVVVSTFDADGLLLTRSPATLDARGIGAGESATFRVHYPGAITIGDAKFELAAKRVATRQGATPAATPPPVATAEPQRRLQISAWRPDPQAPAGSVALIGVLANGSNEVAYDVTLDVALRGADGKELASARALLGSRTLKPGESTSFRVTFPGVTTFGDAAFAARHNVRRSG